MEKIKIFITNSSNNELPKYETAGASAVDLRAKLEKGVIIKPGERKLIPTGLRMVIPFGYEGQIRPRSGLAIRHGVSLVNTPGTIDSDYRGDIGVIVINHGSESITIKNGERIAQMAFVPITQPTFIEFTEEEFNKHSTDRGEGGFGSTGV